MDMGSWPLALLRDAQLVAVLYIDSFSARRDLVDSLWVPRWAVLFSFEVRRRRSVSNGPKVAESGVLSHTSIRLRIWAAATSRIHEAVSF